MSKYKDGDAVYLLCKVSHAPEGNQRLYRLTTISGNSVIWVEEDEFLPAEKYPDELKEDGQCG